jgi:hypothetical protein
MIGSEDSACLSITGAGNAALLNGGENEGGDVLWLFGFRLFPSTALFCSLSLFTTLKSYTAPLSAIERKMK